MLDIFRIIFDRRHVKDMRLWTIMMIALASFSYHQIVIRPMQQRIEKHGKRIRNIIKAGRLEAKISALEKGSKDRER